MKVRQVGLLVCRCVRAVRGYLRHASLGNTLRDGKKGECTCKVVMLRALFQSSSFACASGKFPPLPMRGMTSPNLPGISNKSTFIYFLIIAGTRDLMTLNLL